MRISDWSSDVCSSDLVQEMLGLVEGRVPGKAEHMRVFRYNRALAFFKLGDNTTAVAEASKLVEEYYDALGLTPADVMGRNPPQQIGRASCRESVCQYV